MRIDFSKLQSPKTPKDKASTIIPISSIQFQQEVESDDKKIDLKQSQGSPISFSVRYPYDVAKSLSPEAIEKQMSYMQAKNILPVSTIRFIEKQLMKEDTSSQKKLNQGSKQLQSTEKIIITEEISSFQMKLEPVKQSPKIKSFWESQQRKTEYQKRKLQKQKAVQDQKNKEQKISFKPELNYTQKSKAQQILKKKRKQYWQKNKIDVYNDLYLDGKRIQSKKSLKKIFLEEQTKADILRQRLQNSKGKKQYNIKQTFFQRLDRSLDKIAHRKKLSQNMQEYDPTTGRRMFIPQTIESKVTYHTLFKPNSGIFFKSLSKDNSLESVSGKLNRSMEVTTGINGSVQLISARRSSKDKTSRSKKQYFEIKQQGLKIAQNYANVYFVTEDMDWSVVLSKRQQKILGDFFNSLTCFQHNGKITRQIFVILLRQFYRKLNLYDKQVIRDEIRSRKDNLIKQKSTVELKMKGSKKNSERLGYQANHHSSKVYFV